MTAFLRFTRFTDMSSKLMMLVCLGLILAGGLSLYVSLPIVNSLSSVASDTKHLTALGSGRLRLVELYKLRHTAAEYQVSRCDAQKPVSECRMDWFAPSAVWKTSKEAISSDPGVYWHNEHTLVWIRSDGVWQIDFPWEPVEPVVQDIGMWLGTREHLGLIGDEMTRSFIFAIAGSTFSAAFFCSLLILFFSRRVRRQFAVLSTYIRTLGSGQLQVRPRLLQGDDEVSGLASDVERLSLELATVRERAIEVDRMTTWQTTARKVAHEIKNPLTPIGLVGEQVGLLAGRVTDRAASNLLQEASRVIREEIQSLDRMVQEFTSFARLPKPDLKRLDLCELVSDFINRTQSENGPQLSFVTDLTTAPALLDRAMIFQVFYNLVNNARLAKIDERVTIQLKLTSNGRFYCLDVTDNGPGVPAEIRERMFEAYVTSRSTGEREKGMGLGLTICRQIAYDHGGSLVLHHTSDAGTTMRLRIPMVEE